MLLTGSLLVALAGLCSQNTLGLESVATAKDPWIPQSHVNRYSLMQEMQPVAHFAAELKRVRPRLPSGSTLFFSGVPHFWEVGGGRLVRWAYRDSTLRAYDLTVFSLDRTKGHPAYFFRGDSDSLHDLPPAELRRQVHAAVGPPAVVHPPHARVGDRTHRAHPHLVEIPQ